GLLFPSCLKAFGALGSAEEFAEVARLLPVYGRQLHLAILDALVAIQQRHKEGNPEGEDLLGIFQSEIATGDSICAHQAVRALGYLASRDDVYEFLLSCLSNPEGAIRRAAIKSLRVHRRPGLD